MDRERGEEGEIEGDMHAIQKILSKVKMPSVE